jgi:hypothetical protein
MKRHGYRDPETLEDLRVMAPETLQFVEQNHKPSIKVVLRQGRATGKIEHMPFAFYAAPLLRRSCHHHETRRYAETAPRKMRVPRGFPRLSSSGVFCHGDRPTIADICLVTQVTPAKTLSACPAHL